MLGSTIQRELAEMIQRDLTDPRLTGLPSVTRVKVAPDISTADVFVNVMGTPGQQTAALHALQHSAGLMRTKLTRSLSLRVAPFLRFHLDEQLKKEIAILDLIRLANKEREEREAAAAAVAEPAEDADHVAAAGDAADHPSTGDAQSPASVGADRGADLAAPPGETK